MIVLRQRNYTTTTPSILKPLPKINLEHRGEPDFSRLSTIQLSRIPFVNNFLVNKVLPKIEEIKGGGSSLQRSYSQVNSSQREYSDEEECEDGEDDGDKKKKSKRKRKSRSKKEKSGIKDLSIERLPLEKLPEPVFKNKKTNFGIIGFISKNLEKFNDNNVTIVEG